MAAQGMGWLVHDDALVIAVLGPSDVLRTEHLSQLVGLAKGDGRSVVRADGRGKIPKRRWKLCELFGAD